MTTIGPIAGNPAALPATPTAVEPGPTAPAADGSTKPTADRVDLRGGVSVASRSDDPNLAEAAKAAPQALLNAGSDALGAQAVSDDLLALLD